MITDGLQNTLIKNMAEYGCYFISLCRVCELETNNDVDLIMAAQYALAKGYIKKDFTVIDPANFLSDMLDKKVEVTVSTEKPKEDATYYVECWRNERTGYTHFKLPYFDSLLDSITVKEGDIVSYRNIKIL